MKILKNRLILAILSLFLAFVLIFLVLPLIQNETSKTTQIIRVNNNILKGQKITPEQLSIETVGSYNLPSDVITSIKEIENKYALADLYTGDYILKSKITDKLSSSEEKLSRLDGKYYAISFTVPKISASVSDKIKAGDIISIIAISKDEKSYIPTELTYVEVISTTNSGGVDVDERDNNNDTNNNIAINITVYATKSQALKIAELENTTQAIQTTLIYRPGNEKIKNDYLKTQLDVLKQLEEKDKE